MSLLSVDEARARILADVTPVACEDVDLMEADGRMLAAALQAGRTQPPFDASSMDGYAVRADDVRTPPVTLSVIGEAAAGSSFGGRVAAGQCVRIFTGAPMPDGADTVVIQEDTDRDGDRVVVRQAEPVSANVRKRGFDFSAGETLIPQNSRLTSRDITLAAAMGHARLTVRRRPTVALIATGDELVLPGQEVGPDQIVCSNPYGIAAIVRGAGGEPHFLGIAKDNREDLAALCIQAREMDIIVTIGGASVGDHDLVGPVLQDLGMALGFWRIAMRPGKPLMFGRFDDRFVIGLPGNPVSSLVCTRIFIVPLILAMLGKPASDEVLEAATSAVDMAANGPRQHYMRGVSERGALGDLKVTPVASQDSSLLAPLARSDVLIVRPAGDPPVAAGDTIQIIKMDF